MSLRLPTIDDIRAAHERLKPHIVTTPLLEHPALGDALSAFASAGRDVGYFGKLAAEYMLRRGRRHVGLICGETWLPGDNAFIEGVNHVLHAASGARPMLTTRSVPMEKAIAIAEIRELLARDQRPTGLICRGRFLTEAARQAAEAAQVQIPVQLDVLLAHALVPRKSDQVFLAAVKSWKSISRMAGRMLVRQIEGKPLKTPHRSVPVRLVESGAPIQSDGTSPHSTREFDHA